MYCVVDAGPHPIVDLALPPHPVEKECYDLRDYEEADDRDRNDFSHVARVLHPAFSQVLSSLLVLKLDHLHDFQLALHLADERGERVFADRRQRREAGANRIEDVAALEVAPVAHVVYREARVQVDAKGILAGAVF